LSVISNVSGLMAAFGLAALRSQVISSIADVL
jgi:hypothetical protein